MTAMKLFLPHRRAARAPSEEMTQKGDLGANRVFYVRDQGLVTAWYLARRCEEECYRAQRYGQAFTLLVAEPAAGSNAATVQGKVKDWLRTAVRKADIAGYLGEGRYAVLLPQTELTVARGIAARLSAHIAGVSVGLSTHPEDGAEFDSLAAAAMRRYDEPAHLMQDELAA